MQTRLFDAQQFGSVLVKDLLDVALRQTGLLDVGKRLRVALEVQQDRIVAAGHQLLRTERLPHGQGFRVHVSQLTNLPAGTDAQAQLAAATVMNTTMEEAILQQPGQYLWGYNRYKQPREADTPAPDAARGVE